MSQDEDETRRKEGPIHRDGDQECYTISGDGPYAVCSNGKHNGFPKTKRQTSNQKTEPEE